MSEDTIKARLDRLQIDLDSLSERVRRLEVRFAGAAFAGAFAAELARRLMEGFGQ